MTRNRAARLPREQRELINIAEELRRRRGRQVRLGVRILYTIYPNSERPQRAASWLLNTLGCLPYHQQF